MANVLQAVQTYQKAGLALLQNLSPFISKANTKFKDFDKITANLGDTVTFDLPPRFNTQSGLVVSFQDAKQRVQTLTVDQSENVSYAFTAQQFIFNVRDYMDKFGKAATAELATAVDANVARNCLTQPFRFYGDGVQNLDTYGKIAQALAFYRNFGAPKDATMGVLDDITASTIVNSGLNQFALDRNNKSANSWEVGSFSNCEWMTSNLLPLHTAGTEGEQASVLTVVSVTKNADNAITSITFSGCNAALDADSVKQYDKFQFQDGVAGQPNVRFLTWVGHKPSANPVQFRATADAQSTAGSEVTVSIYPPLKASSGEDQNLNTDIVAGMQAKALPSHREGMIWAGNSLYLAMPQLPEESPFHTGNSYDPDTGVSMRMYHGSQFGENSRGTVHDVIWGSTLPPEYGMSLIFPV